MVIKLRQLITMRVRWQEKQVFDSRSVARGLGLAKYCFCVSVVAFFVVGLVVFISLFLFF